MYRKSPFSDFAKLTARVTGHPASFCIAASVILIWATMGPIYHFSDTWQLVINTSTTIITFLMVFLIQNTQNRDSHSIQLKLDELIRAIEGAHNALLDIEELSEDDLLHIKNRYAKLAQQAREDLKQGKTDIDRPDVAAE